MEPTFLIAVRFLSESKRAMILSSLGVILGVAFFICGQAQTQGFEKYFITTILGSKGAVIVSDRFQESYTQMLEVNGQDVVAVSNPQTRKYYPGINDAQRIMRVLREFPNVKASAPVVEKNVILRSGFRSEVAVLQGIELEYHLAATDFAKQIIAGSLADFRDNRDALAVGSLLSEKMELRLGQNIYLVGPTGDARRFKLTNIYETGVNVIDEKRVYVHHRAAQSTVQEPFLTSFILVQLHHPERAPQDAQAFEELLQHRSRAWQDRERGNLQIFASLRISAALGISCILLLSGFGIFNVLTMSVLEKTKEIAILRSMGYSAQDIASIFLWQGFGIAVLGILMGSLAGAGLTWGVSQIPVKIRGILKADHFIVTWSYEHYVLAAILALISIFIASYIPASRAARIDPVEVLRGTSS